MKNVLKQIKNIYAQTTVEYILFIIIMFLASYGMFKLFSLAWKYKFNLISVTVEAFHALL